jgi:hypothetical protein
MTSTKRALLVLAVAGGLLGAGQATIPSAGASQTLTIAPASPGTLYNAYPFGVGSSNQWPPYAGFVYKNVPAFQLKTGDSLAFDLGAMNDADVQLEIALAATTVNGGDAPSQPFTTVVTNTQTPANPRGDTTVGNFELGFRAQAPFNFPGGGLIIRFSNSSPSYATDVSVTLDIVTATASDPSGNFVERFWSDPDGVPPYLMTGTGDIGGFQLTLADVPPIPPNQPTVVTKKKCKKHKHRTASAKKHCKKKK